MLEPKAIISTYYMTKLRAFSLLRQNTPLKAFHLARFFFFWVNILFIFVPMLCGWHFAIRGGRKPFTTASEFSMRSAESSVCLVFIKGFLKA